MLRNKDVTMTDELRKLESCCKTEEENIMKTGFKFNIQVGRMSSDQAGKILDSQLTNYYHMLTKAPYSESYIYIVLCLGVDQYD